MAFRCQNGVRFFSGSGGANQQISWEPGDATWTLTSDRNAKNGFAPVDGEAVLDKVAALPIQEWNYIGYGQRHMGPMAQDFRAAFGLKWNRGEVMWLLRLAGWGIGWQLKRLGCRRRLPAVIREFRTIRAAGVFDPRWYERRYPAVAGRFADPLWHYVLWGADEGRDPHPLFLTDWYLQRNPDVRAAGVNPLAHYLRRGAAEGRDPHPLFAGNWYLQRNPDVAARGWNPLVHYVKWGGAEGRDPHPLFDSGYFLRQAEEHLRP